MSDKPPPRTIVFKRYMVPNRLAALVDRPGGKWREEAIAEATRNLESVRGESMDVVEELIAEMELRCAEGAKDRLNVSTEIERLANQIITIAETFGLTALSEACKRLCDLVSAGEDRWAKLASPLAIHVRAVRLFAPKSRPLDATSSALVLAELRKVLDHFEIAAPKAIAVD